MGEGSAPLVENLGRTDHFSGLVDHGGAKDRSGKEPRLLVKTRIESQIRIRVLDIHGLAAGKDRAGNPHVIGETDLGRSQPLAHLGVQFVRLFIVDKKGRPLRMQQPCDRLDDLGQKVSQLDFSRDFRHHAEKLRLLGLLFFPQLQQQASLKGNGGLHGHGLEEFEILGGEVSGLPALSVQHFDHPDQLPTNGADGGAGDRSRPISCLLIHGFVETRILVDVLDQKSLPRLENSSRDSRGVENPNLPL